MVGEETGRMEAMDDRRTTEFEAERRRLTRLAYADEEPRDGDDPAAD